MNFLYGTYGFDLLSLCLIILSTFLNISRYTSLLGSMLLVMAIYRAFSKNVYKRNRELQIFVNIINNILLKFNKRLPHNLPKIPLTSLTSIFEKINYYINQKRKFKIVKCKKCRQKLRLPRWKGSIIVTCKKCSHEFRLKT